MRVKRKIINIDKKLCNGCGACAAACHEGAIEMTDGVATLVREDFCDGLGDCLPACPTGAISFEEREAPEYNEAAVKRAAAQKQCKNQGCPGTRARLIESEGGEISALTPRSRLMQWPCQIKLIPTRAPYFEGANLLIAADCAAYARASFHNDFMKNRITLIGCPKLDGVDYSEKLTEIIRENNIKSVCIVRMEVPCCSGIEIAAKRAIQNSGKFIPWQVVTVGTDGKILE